MLSSLSPGSSEDLCLDCEAGKSSEQGTASCSIICPTGRHSPSGSPCLDCEAGKFNENVQQESCTNCGTGRYSTTTGNKVESACRNCEGGKASSPGTILCDLCAIGKYSSAAQSTSCDDCVAGTFNLFEGSVTCDKCPAGQKMNDAGEGCDIRLFAPLHLCLKMEGLKSPLTRFLKSVQKSYFAYFSYIGCNQNGPGIMLCDAKNKCPFDRLCEKKVRKIKRKKDKEKFERQRRIKEEARRKEEAFKQLFEQLTKEGKMSRKIASKDACRMAGISENPTYY
ncbi:hypothetical protein TL16_g08047 [Triparma laevis f. inornata]|uniref:Tyrosine-protein kinase ephrin type A/B receptor-like domain-containing protein n=2 Tax=Triparma laevis TaxID=1534972 RepID=A0A9W7F3Q8_9STRA|nr:hypothetical protein TL16_g08047 [Triparma laevis f. inornata]GMI02049.1 hypothetical protein TrLO_g10442 [Triparma laevis f. longispina]